VITAIDAAQKPLSLDTAMAMARVLPLTRNTRILDKEGDEIAGVVREGGKYVVKEARARGGFNPQTASAQRYTDEIGKRIGGINRPGHQMNCAD
jgi:hypothetical protein